MEKHMNIPELRFPEFEGEWEKKKLGEVTDSISSGKSNNKLAFGEFPFYGSTGLIGYTNNYGYTGKIILIARVGANAGSLYKVDGKYSVSDNTLMLKINDKGILDFVQYYLNKYDLNKLVFGSGQPLITGGHLKELSLYFPDLPEQSKIATFLTAVDEKLQALKKKKSLLEVYKKGVMQKLFSQELRFRSGDGKEFGDWEEKKGRDLFSAISNKNHKSDLPILAISQEFGAVPREMINYQISVTEKSVESYKIVEIGDFIISLRSFQGGIEYSNYKGICSPAYIILRNTKPINSIFFKYYFKTEYYIQRLCEKLEGIRDGKMISYQYFSEIELPYPSVQEQTRIANFISILDEKINHTQTEITKTEVWKKGLLQKMFV